MQRHEIPTHLNVEDKAFYGLSVRQATYLTAGAASSYTLWNQWHALPIGLRLGAALTCFFLAAAVALVRPVARGLEEWAFVVLHYAFVPKLCIWQPRGPDTVSARPSGESWAELAPRLNWQLGPNEGEDKP